jgi:hypothetical protein
VVLAFQATAASASAVAVGAENPEPAIPADAPRPRFELSARTGWNIPTIESGSDVSAGPGVGALFLFRPASGVAFGVSGDVARFPWYDDESLFTITYGADLRFYAAMPRNWELYANALFALVDVSASGRTGGSCGADHGMVLGTTLGAERYFTTSLRLGAELGYHFGGTYTAGCLPIATTGLASIPEFSPGFALRVVGTYGTR